jgi:hypothetical protein
MGGVMENKVENNKPKAKEKIGSNNVFDYHNISNIDTPKREREKLDIGDIYYNAAICFECGDVIRSKNRHHFVTCVCGNLSVGGGSWYAKRTFKKANSYQDMIIMYQDVKEIGRDL